MSGGSVLAHMTDANDTAHEGDAPLYEQKSGERSRAPASSNDSLNSPDRL